MVNPRVYMDIMIGDKPTGRMIIELFAYTTPKTAENFLALCTDGKGTNLHYKGSTFSRLSPAFCHGGNLTYAGEKELEFIYGVNPEPENFIMKHDRPGVVSMCNLFEPSFFITAKEMSFLDGKHVVVGQVVEGIHVVNDIVDFSYDDDVPVVVTDCGQLPYGLSPISPASQITTKLKQVISTFTKQFSIHLKEAWNLNEELAAMEARDISVLENEEDHFVGFAGILEQNLGVLSNLKAGILTLEKCQNEVLSVTRNSITSIKNKKLALKIIASLPDEDIVDIKSEIKKIKKRKRGDY